MEASFNFDDNKEQKIPQKSDDVHAKERNPNPELHRLQARNPNQGQHWGPEDGAIEMGHAALGTAGIRLLN